MNKKPIHSLPNKLSLLLAVAAIAATHARARDEVLFPSDDTYIRGGTYSEESAPGRILEVASRGETNMDNVRKILLRFDINPADVAELGRAELVLTYAPSPVIALEGDPREPVRLLVSCVAEADWSESQLTWSNAPYHDPLSPSEVSSGRLTPVAEVSIDPLEVNEDQELVIADPRLTDFILKNRGPVTFVVSGVASRTHPGFRFYDKDGTSRPERRPKLILRTK